MRKVLVALFTAALLTGGAAFAQGMDMGAHYWAGVSAGYPGVTFHFGVSDVAPNLSVRANVGYGYGGVTGSGFAVGLDGLYNLPVDTGDVPVTVYAGLGPTMVFASDFNIGANVFAGAEYRLGQIGLEQGGVFFEAGPAIYFTPSFQADFVGRLGFNYHF